MKKSFYVLLSVVGMLLLVSRTASAETASSTVKTTVEKVQQTITSSEKELSPEALDEKLREIIAPVFDFQEMARRSLGANWKKATADQQNEFVELFSDLLARNYLKKIRENAANSGFEVAGEVNKDSKALVKTTVLYEGEKASIDYRLREKNGAWRIYDVVIENIGLVSNYRSEFAGIIKSNGVAGLITKLKEKK